MPLSNKEKKTIQSHKTLINQSILDISQEVKSHVSLSNKEKNIHLHKTLVNQSISDISQVAHLDVVGLGEERLEEIPRPVVLFGRDLAVNVRLPQQLNWEMKCFWELVK